MLQIDADRFGCDHRKGRKEIFGKDIVEGLLARLECEHQDLNRFNRNHLMGHQDENAEEG